MGSIGRLLLNQWPTLERVLIDGTIRETCNNGCERALRSVLLGRNNWLFFGSEEGTRDSVVLMSLVQPANNSASTRWPTCAT